MLGFCACIAMPGEHSLFTDVIGGAIKERHQAFLFYTLVKSSNLMVQETQHLVYYISYFLMYYCCIPQAMAILPNTWNERHRFYIDLGDNCPIKVSFAVKAVISA